MAHVGFDRLCWSHTLLNAQEWSPVVLVRTGPRCGRDASAGRDTWLPLMPRNGRKGRAHPVTKPMGLTLPAQTTQLLNPTQNTSCVPADNTPITVPANQSTPLCLTCHSSPFKPRAPAPAYASPARRTILTPLLPLARTPSPLPTRQDQGRRSAPAMTQSAQRTKIPTPGNSPRPSPFRSHPLTTLLLA